MQHDSRQDHSKIEYLAEWENVCDRFKGHYSEDIFNSWLGNCIFEKITGNTAIINAPTRFIREHIEAEYKEKLQIFWQQVNADIEQVRVTTGRSARNLEVNKPQTAQIIQLPLWPESTRGVPNSAFRGSLFAAIDPRKRQAYQRETLVDEKNLKIIFTGWQLDQSDLDVWEQALHMARQQPLGKDIYFTAHGFLKALGRSTGKAQHEWLKKSLARLVGCAVEVTHNKYTYVNNLLCFERDEKTQCYKLSIDIKMMKLYTAGWTQTDWQERQKIGKRKPLALWLHGYIASHAQMYPTKVETFYRLSGSKNSDMYSFKQKLFESLQHLKEINLIKDFYFENSLVHIEKYPSQSQMKHLAKKKKQSINIIKKHGIRDR